MLWTYRTRILVVIAIVIGGSLMLFVTRPTSGGEFAAGIDAGFGGVGGLDASRPLEAGRRD